MATINKEWSVETIDREAFLKGISTHTDLGHKKRNDTFLRQISQLLNKPGGTATGSDGSWADAVSAYRFAENEKIPLSSLRDIRRESIISETDVNSPILLIHDMSELSYYHHESKQDRRNIGDGKGLGYEYICNLGIRLSDETFMGVFHDCLVTKDGPDDKNILDYHCFDKLSCFSKNEPQRLEENHRHQMTIHNRYIRQSHPQYNFITTGDREFDDQFFLKTALITTMIMSFVVVHYGTYRSLPMTGFQKMQLLKNIPDFR